MLNSDPKSQENIKSFLSLDFPRLSVGEAAFPSASLNDKGLRRGLLVLLSALQFWIRGWEGKRRKKMTP